MEWLGESGASRHVWNELSLLRDVRIREDPILLRQLSGELKVHTTGTVKLECRNKEDFPVTLHLCDTLYIPRAKSAVFKILERLTAEWSSRRRSVQSGS